MLALVAAFLKLANILAGYLDKRQMLEAGKALANSDNLQRATDAYRAASAARDVIGDRIRVDPGWMPSDDPNRRD